MVTPDSTAAQPVWHIAFVGHNTEKAVEQRLQKLGLETYVATQLQTRIWKNGRKAKIQKVVIPLVVFIKCTEEERRKIVALPYINRFMVNRASGSGNGLSSPVATISQKEIDTLRQMLGQSDIPVSFVDTPFKVNDDVTVIKGTLSGISGKVIATTENKSEVIVAIGLLGAAKMTIDASHLELTAPEILHNSSL